jgi:hypothetical protein
MTPQGGEGLLAELTAIEIDEFAPYRASARLPSSAIG